MSLMSRQRFMGAAPTGPQNLVYTWRTTTPDETVTVQCSNAAGLNFDAVLDWGDGTQSVITSFDDPDLVHVYATPGDWRMEVIGVMDSIRFYLAAAMAAKLVKLDGDGSAQLRDYDYAFENCSNLTKMPLLDTSGVERFIAAFYNCSQLTMSLPINLSSAKFLYRTFRNCLSVISVPSLSLENAVDLEQIFYSCANLVDFPPNVFDNWSATPVPGCFLNAWGLCNSLSAVSVVNILQSIDASGVSAPASSVDITIDYAGGDISAASDAITGLKSRGWTVTINGTPQ